jgi:hypothetical protein
MHVVGTDVAEEVGPTPAGLMHVTVVLVGFLKLGPTKFAPWIISGRVVPMELATSTHTFVGEETLLVAQPVAVG